jgi:Asp-tRNA(Asn)/Glu-tRNA(Gln) amidotransferase A subunit family amidase
MANPDIPTFPGTMATVASLATAVKAKTKTASSVLEASLATIAAKDPQLKCFTDLTAPRARQRAAQLDATLEPGARARPSSRGALCSQKPV